MRLLLVEDDQLLGEGIQAGLGDDGYAVDWVTDGDSAIRATGEEEYDIILLDLGLPKRSGLEVLKYLRDRGTNTPVLVLTARDTTRDKVAGLDSGADDYLTKPFDLDELCARLRALARRRGGRRSPVIRHREIVFDPAAHAVSRNGDPVEVSPKEFTILQILLQNRGEIQSRKHLEEGLYAWGHEVDSNVVEVHIHHLRKKLGDGLIRTVRGVGYVIDSLDE